MQTAKTAVTNPEATAKIILIYKNKNFKDRF